MYQNYPGNFTYQSMSPTPWGGYVKPHDEERRTGHFDNIFNVSDESVGDTSCPLVRQGILPPVQIILNADNETVNGIGLPSIDLLEDLDESSSSLDSDNWFVPVAKTDAGQEFITYIRRLPDGTTIFVHTPANEEGIVQRIVEPDGTIVEHYENGDKLSEFATTVDGGLAWSLEAQDGSRVYEYIDGSRVIINSDGTTSFEQADSYQDDNAA